MYVEDDYKFIFRYVQLEDAFGTSNWGSKKKVSVGAMEQIIPRDNV